MIASYDQDRSSSTIRIAILGASGFIGRWVARALGTRSAKLYLVVRNKSVSEGVFSKYHVHGKILEADLSDSNEVRKLFHEVRPSITFNLSGYGVKPTERDPETSHRINTHLVSAICEAVAETRDADWPGQDIVHVGSALEYGAIGGNLSEDSAPNPTTDYGRSKLQGTATLARNCKARGIKGVTARLFTVYGPGEHQGRLLPSLLDAARAGESLGLTDGVQKRDFTYVEDVAEGLLRLGLVTTKPGEIVNLATGHLMTVRSFAETAAGIMKIPSDRLEFGALPTRTEEMEHATVAIERLRRLTTWVPSTGIEEGILRTLAFAKVQGVGAN